MLLKYYRVSVQCTAREESSAFTRVHRDPRINANSLKRFYGAACVRYCFGSDTREYIIIYYYYARVNHALVKKGVRKAGNDFAETRPVDPGFRQTTQHTTVL